MTKRIKEKIEELHNKYTLHLESPRMRFGGNVYFEENGYILCSKADDALKIWAFLVPILNGSEFHQMRGTWLPAYKVKILKRQPVLL